MNPPQRKLCLTDPGNTTNFQCIPLKCYPNQSLLCYVQNKPDTFISIRWLTVIDNIVFMLGFYSGRLQREYVVCHSWLIVWSVQSLIHGVWLVMLSRPLYVEYYVPLVPIHYERDSVHIGRHPKPTWPPNALMCFSIKNNVITHTS